MPINIDLNLDPSQLEDNVSPPMENNTMVLLDLNQLPSIYAQEEGNISSR